MPSHLRGENKDSSSYTLGPLLPLSLYHVLDTDSGLHDTLSKGAHFLCDAI